MLGLRARIRIRIRIRNTALVSRNAMLSSKSKTPEITRHYRSKRTIPYILNLIFSFIMAKPGGGGRGLQDLFRPLDPEPFKQKKEKLILSHDYNEFQTLFYQRINIKNFCFAYFFYSAIILATPPPII